MVKIDCTYFSEFYSYFYETYIFSKSTFFDRTIFTLRILLILNLNVICPMYMHILQPTCPICPRGTGMILYTCLYLDNNPVANNEIGRALL